MAVFKTNLKPLMLQKSVELGYALTQKEVAEATGLSLPTLSRWYKGEIDRLEAETAAQLMKYFGCDFSDLVRLSEE